MLIALLTVLLLGGGSDAPMPDGFTKQMKQVVVEKDRQKDIEGVTKSMKKITSEYAKQAKELTKEAYALNRDYGTSPSELEAVVDRYREERHALEVDLVAQRLKLAELMSKEEWDEIMRRIDAAGKK